MMCKIVQGQQKYLQLKGGRGLWHGVINKSVAEGHKLVADDFDGFLGSRSFKTMETFQSCVIKLIR